MSRNVLSLFSSAGIGELGIKAKGWPILISNEIVENRCQLYRENYPNVDNICGDIWEKKDEIIEHWKEKTKEPPFLIYATPPFANGGHLMGQEKYYERFVMERGNQKIHVID